MEKAWDEFRNGPDGVFINGENCEAVRRAFMKGFASGNKAGDISSPYKSMFRSLICTVHDILDVVKENGLTVPDTTRERLADDIKTFKEWFK